MNLREPKKKRVGSHIKPQQSFPILIESETGIPLDSDLWPVYTGHFSGDCVIICDQEEMRALYTMGFFGKGSFSRGYPSFGLTKKGIPPIIKERQWQRRKSWMNKMKQNLAQALGPEKSTVDENDIVKDSNIVEAEPSTDKPTSMDIDTTSDNNEKENVLHSQDRTTDVDVSSIPMNINIDLKNNGNHIADTVIGDKVLVLADSDDEDIEKVIREPKPHLEKETLKTVVENLNLTLEEAYFLSYGLGCLQVIDMFGKALNLTQLWQTFCEVKADFIESYAVYHYFRAKGWVVKSGYKFGGDFLLYKQGPPFYHASYIVFVEKVDSKLKRLKNSFTWIKLHGLNRLAENSGKDIITCQVIFPCTLTAEDLLSPRSLSSLQVNELLTKRWIPSQEREDKEQS